MAAASSRRASATSSSSVRWSTCSSPIRPSEHLTTSTAAPASLPLASRCGHLTVEKVTALTARPSTAGTRYPLPSGRGWNAPCGIARVTIAMLAYSISPSSAPAAGTSAWSNRPAGRAGNASTTASARTYSGSCAEPTVSCQPSGVRRSSRTDVPVRTCAPEAAATAAGRVPRPPASVVNTGSPRPPAPPPPPRSSGPPGPSSGAPAESGPRVLRLEAATTDRAAAVKVRW